MQIEIQHRPSNSIAIIGLAAGETLTSEGGAMMAMTGNIKVETTTKKKKGGKGGLKAGLKRMLTGESYFLNHYTAIEDGSIWLVPSLIGDMKVFEISSNTSLFLQGGSFVANTAGVDIETNYKGLKSLVGGEGLFWMKVKGSGKLLTSAFGEIYEEKVDGSFIVDSGHLVAFEDSLTFKISKVGKSWLSSFLGGEGFVLKLEGKGTVWCQSHNPGSFGKLLTPRLRSR